MTDDARSRIERRSFLRCVGAAGCGMLAHAAGILPLPARAAGARKTPATVRCGFFYPPSETLQGHWWSWPGNDFDAEGHQARYTEALGRIAQELGMEITVEPKPLDAAADVARFTDDVKRTAPDGMLLVPLKHSHFAQTDEVIRATSLPTVVFSNTGVKHGSITKYFRPGCHIITSHDNLDALAYAMRTIATARWMREARILSLAGNVEPGETVVPHLGTTIRKLPISRFVEVVDATEVTDEVRDLARSFRSHAREVREPKWPEIVTAARVHFALARLMAEEGADAVMMQCLDRGLYQPCMSFMRLRDEGIAAGCENDLGPTLTMMLVQQLFGRPGFQHNPTFETEANHYFASHCTCPTRLFGPNRPQQPYILRDFAHTNDPTCVPQVLWRPGEPVTMARYLGGEPPSMLLYSGEVVRSYAEPQTAGCRTNVEITINELQRAVDVKGHHNILFYGDSAEDLRTFCRLFSIEVVV